jgi:hypothetical protein
VAAEPALSLSNGSAANECDILPAMASREQNEQKFKEVDAAERTIRFAQEIYDQTGRLVAVHEKFPVDLGHKTL